MSVKQVSICSGGECNGECYKCRLKSLLAERNALLKALKQTVNERIGPLEKVSWQTCERARALIALVEGKS